jgi:uncharacterized membrane protein YbhN (UPF0104 family)
MKLSNEFDARCLRPKGPRRWCERLGAGLALLCLLGGLFVLLLAGASLISNPLAFDEPKVAAAILFLGGLLLLGAAKLCWRLCRRRQRKQGELSMAPHLMKKHH